MKRNTESKKRNPKSAGLPPTFAKHHKKDRKICPPIGKKAKENKRKSMGIKKAVKRLTEYAENESSSRELPKEENVKKVPSTNSVIYVGTSHSSPGGDNNAPVIDLTNDNDTLKTLFFNKTNFERRYKLRKYSATTSLITLPVVKNVSLEKLNSTTALIAKNIKKLACLNIPEECLSYEDLTYTDADISKKSELTASDNEIIKWVLQNENDCDLDACSSSISSLNLSLSVEEMVKTYGISPHDNFD